MSFALVATGVDPLSPFSAWIKDLPEGRSIVSHSCAPGSCAIFIMMATESQDILNILQNDFARAGFRSAFLKEEAGGIVADWDLEEAKDDLFIQCYIFTTPAGRFVRLFADQNPK